MEECDRDLLCPDSIAGKEAAELSGVMATQRMDTLD